MKKLDIAWFAGFLDGEGHLGSHLSKKKSWPAFIQMTNTCSETVKRLHGLWPASGSHYPAKGNHKAYWTWQLGRKNEVKKLLTELLPYLITKRKQAILLLEIIETPKSDRKILVEQLHQLNKRGI